MPIIATIGRRSAKVRIAHTMMYIVLAIGALSMIYPLLIMLGGSARSEVDFDQLSPLPTYLWADNVLWAKFVQAKYGKMFDVERWQRTEYGSWRFLKPPPLEHLELAEKFREFRKTDWPIELYQLGHSESLQVVAKNARLYRHTAQAM